MGLDLGTGGLGSLGCGFPGTFLGSLVRNLGFFLFGFGNTQNLKQPLTGSLWGCPVPLVFGTGTFWSLGSFFPGGAFRTPWVRNPWVFTPLGLGTPKKLFYDLLTGVPLWVCAVPGFRTRELCSLGPFPRGFWVPVGPWFSLPLVWTPILLPHLRAPLGVGQVPLVSPGKPEPQGRVGPFEANHRVRSFQLRGLCNQGCR